MKAIEKVMPNFRDGFDFTMQSKPSLKLGITFSIAFIYLDLFPPYFSRSHFQV